MKTLYFISAMACLSPALSATTLYSRANGSWNTAGTWSTIGLGMASCGYTPGNGDTVIIGNNNAINDIFSIALGGGGNPTSLTIQAGANLDLFGNNTAVNTGATLNICGTMTLQNISISTGVTFTMCTGSILNVTKNFSDLSNLSVNGLISVAKNFSNGPDVISGTGCIEVGGNYSNAGTVFGSTNPTVVPPCGSALPIQLIRFSATYQTESNSVLVSWSVATQLNNKAFVIEKTLDGSNYEEIATVPGAGNTTFAQSYSIIDNKPTPGTSYYRLKQVDIDGNTTLFPPTSVFVGSTISNSLSMYPNPVNANGTLVYTSTNTDPLQITIIDMTGRELSNYIVNTIQSGENTIQVNTSSLTGGIYFIRATTPEKSYTLKFNKE